MTLQRLLACFMGLLGLDILITMEHWIFLYSDGFFLMLGVIVNLLIAGFLLLQRMQIARWILGRHGDLPAHLDYRGLLAVGAATVGMFFLVEASQWLFFTIAFYGWVGGGGMVHPDWQLRWFGLCYTVGALLTVCARWLPTWVGWGRLGDPRRHNPEL